MNPLRPDANHKLRLFGQSGTGAWVLTAQVNGPDPAEFLHGTFTVPATSLTTAVLVNAYQPTNYTKPSGCGAVDLGTFATLSSFKNGSTYSCSLGTLAAGSHTVGWGVDNPDGFEQTAAWSVKASAVPTGPQAGPEVFANPETWAWSGVLSFAPAIATMSPTVGTSWLLPDANPSFATVQPFLSNVTDPKTGLGALNTAGPTLCLVPTAKNCSLAASPLYVLDYIGGNSTLVGGSVFPTHEDGSGAGYAVHLTDCFVAQTGATASNVTYSPSQASGICGFDHNTINSTVYVVCQRGMLFRCFVMSHAAARPRADVLGVRRNVSQLDCGSHRVGALGDSFHRSRRLRHWRTHRARHYRRGYRPRRLARFQDRRASLRGRGGGLRSTVRSRSERADTRESQRYQESLRRMDRRYGRND